MNIEHRLIIDVYQSNFDEKELSIEICGLTTSIIKHLELSFIKSDVGQYLSSYIHTDLLETKKTLIDVRQCPFERFTDSELNHRLLPLEAR